MFYRGMDPSEWFDSTRSETSNPMYFQAILIESIDIMESFHKLELLDLSRLPRLPLRASRAT